MSRILIAAVAIVGLVLLDRVLRKMESRGWIYYRKTSGSSGSLLGPALEQLQGAVDPGAKAAIEYRMEEHAEEAKAGDPKRPWEEKLGGEPDVESGDARGDQAPVRRG